MKRLIAFVVFIAVFFSSINIVINRHVLSKSSNDENIEVFKIEGVGAVLMDTLEGSILYQKNIHMRLYPASTTKILTALIAIESGDLNDMVTVCDEIDLISSDSSKAGLVKGEGISLLNLLKGLLIPSGNDAACTIAVHMARKISGNLSMETDKAIAYFVKIMNQRAKRIGALDSNFANPHGYHDENHYSTPYDIALIAREAMEEKIFRTIVNTLYFETPIIFGNENISENKNYHKWTNSNELILKNSKYYYEYADGIKTGFTAPAGYCLVSYAEKDGINLISVILKSSQTGRWEDSKKLLNYGIENFEKYCIKRANDDICILEAGNPFTKGNGTFSAVSDRDIFKIIKKEDIPRIGIHFEFDKKLLEKNEKSDSVRLKKSISKGQVIGNITYSLGGDIIGKANLLSDRDIRKDWKSVFIGDVEISTLFIIILLIIIIAQGIIMSSYGKYKKNNSKIHRC